ncbi:hypothetical protein QBC37DRAFT_296691 [Rhypophila decipiens]|uniref:SAP domain-containing protein n=1 Tax=Rhypophila decipiens TaxID=261697 RepID=A0AAN6Y1J5_9PEZI|nr:hypothetical protein QBC37DRAFT_296691 [Rhypophila decipiens]
MATEWGRLTVVDLRQQLKQRGLPTTGKKADLVERLTAAESKERTDTEASPEKPETGREVNPEQAETSETIKSSPAPSPPASDPKIEEVGRLETIKNSPARSPPASDPKPEEVERLEPTNKSPAPSPPASNPTRGDVDTDESLNPPPTKSELMDTTPIETAMVDDSAGVRDENGVPNPAVAEVSPDLSMDARGRKRRSRTPPPSDDESSRKRARPSEQHDMDEIHSIDEATLVGEEVLPLDDDPAGKDSSYAKLLPDIPTEHRGDESIVNESLATTHQPDGGDRSFQSDPDVFMEDISDFEPSIHPATSALYIKNFMRPLKPEVVRDYLVELATPPGRPFDPEIVSKFFLDPIRTHAFVQFDSVAAASRVRVRLHSTVWPEERERKALWVDFVPPDKVAEWIEHEEKTKERGKSFRWELIYEVGRDGQVHLELVDSSDHDNAQTTRPRQMSSSMPIPTGPARQFPGIEGAPSGPRGNGFFRDVQLGSGSGRGGGGRAELWTTTGRPQISYKPVPDEVAQRRLDNMRSYYTKDKNRDMGREDEINRYTFEKEASFVDRGVENFVGIRRPPGVRLPPRYASRSMGPRGPRGPRGPPPFAGDRSSRRRDVYHPERGVPRSDVPRSRLDGAPLPTFGGGGNSGRGRYWGHR